MEFSKKAKENIESCRFCWMCHHICPVGNATGQERNTARARALGLSLVTRKAIDYSDDIINNVYECSLCGGCVADCTTGWDPVLFTKEARLGAALDGKLPPYIMKMIENIQTKGNVYGKEKNETLPVFEGNDTLLFLGEDTRAFGDAGAVINILQKAGVAFDILSDEPLSGYSMEFLVGEAAETKELAEKCAKVLNKYKKVICYDPADAKIMMREYKEWGIGLSAQVITFTQFLAELIKSGKIKANKTKQSFTPQDSPILARDLEETEPMREILSACGDIREMLLNKKDTMLAGNLIMSEYMPDVMDKIASGRWTNALNVNAEILVTASTAEYEALKRTKPENAEVLKIEEAVLKCL